MGRILECKPVGKKVKCIVCADIDEGLQLGGKLKDVYLFCSDACDTKAGVCESGDNYSTKYFEVPKKLKVKGDMGKEISCQKLESRGKTFFIYIIRRRHQKT